MKMLLKCDYEGEETAEGLRAWRKERKRDKENNKESIRSSHRFQRNICLELLLGASSK